MLSRGKAHPSGRPYSRRDIRRLRYLQSIIIILLYHHRYCFSFIIISITKHSEEEGGEEFMVSSVPSILPKLCQSYHHTITARKVSLGILSLSAIGGGRELKLIN